MICCKVKVRKGQLDRFRKKAKASKKEIQAFLVGKVVNPELVVVERIMYVPKYATQGKLIVQCYQEDYDNIRTKAEEKGWKIVGDIHSHPNYWPVLSDVDYKNHIKEGHRILGICTCMFGKTKVFMWVADSALPCDIEYIK